MARLVFILIIALLLSCGEQKKQREVEWSSVEVEESRDTVLVQRSLRRSRFLLQDL